MYDEDFVDETVVDLGIANRPGFKYKPTTAGDENDWLSEYIVFDEIQEKNVQDLGKLNQCKLRNLVEIPYTKEHINKALGIEKEWKELNKEERWNFLRKLKPIMFSSIVKSIDRIDSPAKKAGSSNKSVAATLSKDSK